MAKITYTDKVALTSPPGNEENQWRDNNANEVKTIVNENAESHNITGTVYLDKTAGNWVNTYSSPTSATIPINLTEAVNGGCAGVWHNAATLELSSVKSILISGNYLANEINLIWFIWDSVSDKVIVNIQNEFILQSGAASNILFEDNFSGTSIDSGKWDVQQNDGANVVFTQNNSLIITRLGNSIGDKLANGIVAQTGLTLDLSTKPLVITYDLQTDTNQHETPFTVGIKKIQTVTNDDDYIANTARGVADTFSHRVRQATVNELLSNTTYDISVRTSLKIVLTIADQVLFYYWSGAWVQFPTGAVGSVTVSGVWFPVIGAGDQISSITTIWSYKILNEDFLTQYP